MGFVTAVPLRIKTSEFVQQKPTDNVFPSAFICHIQGNEKYKDQIHPTPVCKKPICEKNEMFNFVTVGTIPSFV